MKFEDLSIEDLDETLSALKADMEPIASQLAELNTKWRKLHDRTKKYEERKQVLMYQQMQESGKVDWAMLLDAGPSGDKYYKELKNALKEQWNQKTVTTSGYFPETNQHGLRVTFTKGDLKQIAEATTVIRELLPFLKAVPSMGWVIIDIFESTLSEFGSIKMGYCHESGTWGCGVFRRSYGNDKGKNFKWPYEFKDLKECLTFVSNHFPYEL